MNRFLLGVLMGSLGTLSAWTEESWLEAREYGEVQVVVAADAHENDRLAAQEFASYWEKATGHSVAVGHTPGMGVNAWIGVKGLPESLLEGIDLAALAPDGLHIRSHASPPVGRKALVIVGAGDRGTLNGVYEFFERFIGVRWLAPGVTFVPAPPQAPLPAQAAPWERNTPSVLPAMDFSYVSPFHYRWTVHESSEDAFARPHRLTQYPGFGLWVHTLFTLLPPEQYFAEHPEYYSEIEGERVAPAGLAWYSFPISAEMWRDHGHRFAQLCFTNPDAADVVAQNLLERIRANPEPRIWSVSQMDWGGYCQCAACAAVNEAEGSPMGSLLLFVNRVAERVEKEFPHHFIETLAYTWSRRLPKTVRPRDNVIIRLCSIECDFARPLNDPASLENQWFARDIRDWSQAAKQLYIWDYTVNFHHYHLPHPNLNVLQENMQFFAEHKVRGVFEQGLGAPRVDLGYIRPYLLARLLWNPHLDYAAAKEEFIDLFYRETAPHYRRYLDLIHDAVREKNWRMDTFDRGGWITKTLVEEARDVLNEAMETATSEEIRERIRYELLSVEYAALVAPPDVRIDGKTFVLEWPESMSVEAYVAMAKSFGAPEFAEGRPIDALPQRVTTRAHHRESYPIASIENSRYELWVTPGLEGSIIRWRDKQHGLELIDGFRSYGVRPSTWQDWQNTPFVAEKPAARRYDVVEATPHRLCLRATLDSGLIVQRTMTLEAEADRLHVALELHNPTVAPLDASIKSHPEFYDQGGHVPELWGQKDGEWRRLDAAPGLPPRMAHGEYLPAAGVSALAFHIEPEKVTVVCEFQPENVEGLLWFFNASRDAQQVNLELLPPTTPLAPGASIVLQADYYVTRERPGG